jgi:hypothetical protein
MTGLGVGALVAGALAQYAATPLLLPFLAYFPLLGVSALLAFWARNCQASKAPDRANIAAAPNRRAPRHSRAIYRRSATAFAVFSLAGFYFALIPSILRDTLHVTNIAVSGAVIFELGMSGLVTTIATWMLKSRQAQILGLALLLPSLNSTRAGASSGIDAVRVVRSLAKRCRRCTRISRQSTNRQ